MSWVRFRVPFAPTAWQRAGVRWTHQGPRHFTQEATREWEATVGLYARKAMAGLAPIQGPVELQLTFDLPIPLTWPQWKRAAAARGEIAATSKPDLDNLEKAVKDAMNGIAWGDDCQVVKTTKIKRYAMTPGVDVELSGLPYLLPAQVKSRPPKKPVEA